MRRRLPLLLLVLGALVAFAPAAAADPLSRITAVLGTKGSLPPCQFSVATLNAALKEDEGGFDAQYAASDSDAIRTALAARGTGLCIKGAGARSSGTAITVPAGTAGEPSSVTSATSAGVPAPLAILGGFVALLLVGLAVRATRRTRGTDPLWAADFRHASSEAGLRLGLAWAQLADRLRRR